MIGQTDHATYTPALSYHPLANLFPMIEGPERVAFRQSIRDKGLRVKIVMHEGMILDGRNRYRELLGLQLIEHGTDWTTSPYFRAFGSEETDGDDPLAFVLDLNLDRRHLNESQRASVAARMATMTRGERTDLKDGSSLGDGLEKTSRAEAAERLNVSERSVNSAKKVQDSGAAELVDAVDQGVLAVSVAEKLLTLPVEEQKRLVLEETPAVIKNAAKKAQRADKEIKLAAKQKALPNKRYGVVYVDPAWRFEPRNRETGLDRAADNHYPTMTTEEIIALPVGDIAAADCAMFMWATVPMLTDALKTMAAWGFAYKSQFIWDKTPWDGDGSANEIAGRQGQGFWGRVNHEILLLGTRGTPTCPAPGDNWPSVYREVAGEHSVKPEHYARMIESYFPNLPKIELNARAPRDGWEVWGNESEGKDATSPLPPAPGANAPVEFSVGGMRNKVKASFSVRLDASGKFATACDASSSGRGVATPAGHGAHLTYAEALRAGLVTVYRFLFGLTDPIDGTVTEGERRAARAGIEWLEARAAEWRVDWSPLAGEAMAKRVRTPISEPEWDDYRALGFLDGGMVVTGPLVDDLVARGFLNLEKKVTPAGKAYLARLEPMVKAASDGDMISVAAVGDDGFIDVDTAADRSGVPTPIPGPVAQGAYAASLGFSEGDRGYRRAPDGQPTVADLVTPGTVVTTSYETGPYIVLRVSGPHWYAPDRGPHERGLSAEEAAVATDRVFPHYSLVMVGEHDFIEKPSKKTLKETSYLNEVVAIDGRLLKLFEANADETFIKGFNADAALILGASTEPPKTFADFVQVDPCPDRWIAAPAVIGLADVTPQTLLEMKILWALMAGQHVTEGPVVAELIQAGLIQRSGGALELTQRGYADGERLGDLVKAATDDDGKVRVAGMVADTSDVSSAYAAELQKVAHLKGALHQSTAEAVMRAGYAERISIAQLEADLGHPKGTIKTWANRLKLTSADRMHEAQVRFDQMADVVPDINGDEIKAGLKVTLTEDVVATPYEVRRVYQNGNISISNATGHQQVIKAGEFVLAYEEEVVA